MKITKHKTASPGVYAVRADGEPTRLLIMKDDGRRKWGEGQEWDVYREVPGDPGPRWLFTARSLEGAHTTLQVLANSFRGDFT